MASKISFQIQMPDPHHRTSQEARTQPGGHCTFTPGTHHLGSTLASKTDAPRAAQEGAVKKKQNTQAPPTLPQEGAVQKKQNTQAPPTLPVASLQPSNCSYLHNRTGEELGEVSLRF